MSAVVLRSVTINRPRQELYAFWRDLPKLAQFMENIERIEVLDERRSHWVVKGPGGKSVEFDSVLTEDKPGERLAWESAEGADIKHAGFVEFRDGPTGRGTEVHAHIVYEPPGGEAGKWIAALFQKEPGLQARRELRRFKQLMETGEISTAEAPDAAPRGTFS